ncbi:CC0125/CC1285 family lipoprotein [Methylobacterium sp. D48H]
MKWLVGASVALALAGCQTAYQKTGLTGGYDELRLSENTYRVSVKGNGFTSKERAGDIALLRAAELTLESGYDRFSVVGGEGVSSQVSGFDPIQTNRYGNTLVTTGGDPVFKPGGNIVVRMLRPKDAGYADALDATLIATQLRSKIVPS